MRRILGLVLALSALLPARPVEAQIAVKILDAPASVFSFEPVYVTFEVRNEGKKLVDIPGDGCSGAGAFVEVGPRGGPFYDPFPIYDCTPNQIITLAPGTRWLFFQKVQLGAQGEYEVRAVLRSSGQCLGQPFRSQRERLEAARHVVTGTAPYDCWAGDEASQRVPVGVKVPDSEIDLAAAEYLEIDNPRWSGGNWKSALIHRVRDLFRQFPTSHYTYAAYSSAFSAFGMLNVVILQPDNPLNPRVAVAMSVALAARNRPCAHPKPWGPPAPPDQDERFARIIAAYPPPAPVKDYLRQMEQEIAAEECPEPAGAKGQPSP